MTYRSLLFSTAALLVPLTPAAAQEATQQPAVTPAPQPAPQPPVEQAAPEDAPAAAATTRAAQPADEYSDEEEIVVTGARARGSVVGDIPPENTLDARDVRATGATSINELL